MPIVHDGVSPDHDPDESAVVNAPVRVKKPLPDPLSLDTGTLDLCRTRVHLPQDQVLRRVLEAGEVVFMTSRASWAAHVHEKGVTIGQSTAGWVSLRVDGVPVVVGPAVAVLAVLPHDLCLN